MMEFNGAMLKLGAMVLTVLGWFEYRMRGKASGKRVDDIVQHLDTRFGDFKAYSQAQFDDIKKEIRSNRK